MLSRTTHITGYIKKHHGRLPVLLGGLAILWAATHCAKLDDSLGLCFLPAELTAVAAIAPVPIGSCATSATTSDDTGSGDSGDSGTPTVSIPVTVQTGTLTLAGPGAAGSHTATAAISSVDTTSSFLIFQARHNSNRPPGSAVIGRILDSTTVEFTKVTDETSVMTIRWYVVTYPSEFVRVQGGTSARATSPVNETITAVGGLNRAFVLQSQTPVATDGTWSNDDATTVSLSAVNTVSINAAGANAGHNTRWDVVEYLSADHIEVQSTTTTLTGGALTATVPLTTAVDVSRTITLVSLASNGSGNDMGARLLRSSLADSSNVTLEHGISGDSDDLSEIILQTVEFKDGSTVQSGTLDFTAGVSQQSVAITSVDTTKSVALVSGQNGAGQSMGLSDYNADDITGVCSVTTTLTATQLTMDRDQTGGTCSVAWYVIKFGTD